LATATAESDGREVSRISAMASVAGGNSDVQVHIAPQSSADIPDMATAVLEGANVLAFGEGVITGSSPGYQPGTLAPDMIDYLIGQGALGGESGAAGSLSFDFSLNDAGMLKINLLDSLLVSGAGLDSSGIMGLDVWVNGLSVWSADFVGNLESTGLYGFYNTIYDLGMYGAGDYTLDIDFYLSGLGAGDALFGEFDFGVASVVPLPAAFWLLISGLVGLFAVSRPRHR